MKMIISPELSFLRFSETKVKAKKRHLARKLLEKRETSIETA
jgi:hypothetical protein